MHVRRASDRNGRAGRRGGRTAWALALGAGLCAAACLPGCDGPSADERALESARQTMLALHAGQTPMTAKTRRESQRAVIDALRPHAEKMDGASGMAAWSLVAQAQAGVAQVDAEEAGACAQDALGAAASARAKADLYIAQRGLVSSLGRPAPADALADLDRQGAALDAELTGAREAKRKDADRLGALEAQAAEQAALAHERRTAELAQREAAALAAPSERAAAYEASYGTSRQAAAFERKSSEIVAEAETVRPLLAAHDLEIDRITRQRALVDAAKRDIDTVIRSWREHAETTAAEAAQVASELRADLVALSTMLVDRCLKEHDEAAAGLTSAIQSARNALQAAGTGDSRTNASLALAGHQQALGEVKSSRAKVIGATLGLFELALGLEPPVPDRPALEEATAKLREERDRSAAEAMTAFEQARSTLASAGGRGELGERIKSVAAMLPGAPPEQAPESAPEQAPESAPESNTESNPENAPAPAPEPTSAPPGA